MNIQVPRIMIAAPKSGTGKTIVTCGILQELKQGVRPPAFKPAKLRRGSDPLPSNPQNSAGGLTPCSFKCGPDYIDPMFHREILGVPSRNLDLFLCGRDFVRHCLAEQASCMDGSCVCVMEGVMGYYDGLGGVSDRASSYDVAAATDTPVILVVDARGSSLSLAALIQGFQTFREDSRICGVILNRISPAMYGRMKEMLESRLSVRVLGYLPERKDLALESRHLGLKLPGEVQNLKMWAQELGNQVRETVDLEGILEVADQAPGLEIPETNMEQNLESVKISVARDEAFCFLYQDNLSILEKMGARIEYFSPLHDKTLPEGTKGILLYGGYPELYAQKLSENESMRDGIREAVESGIPCMAECGGFQYLQEYIKTEDGKWPMAGVFKGGSYPTGRLCRFGYVTLSGGRVFGQHAGEIPAHEFHYYDSEYCGNDFQAKKPMSDRSWNCMISTDSILAGYPHIHYGGCPNVAQAFLDACRRKRE